MTKIAFYTLGCKSNQYETDSMKKTCSAAGFEIVPPDLPADIYVINTCTVTGNADKKSRHAIRFAKKINNNSTVIATGCYVEASPPELYKIKEADILLKNADKQNILSFLPKNSLPSRVSRLTSPVRTNLMIENGCNNFCSYCIVPYVRGKIESKPFDQVISEAKKMTNDGVKEIVLTGINLGEYNIDSSSRISHLASPISHLVSLVNELSKIDGLLRIRLSSIEPMYITDELIRTVKENPKVCKHLHIPMQSGDDKILSSMNRNYSSKDFLNMANRIKKQVKDVAITTDVIVGFPEEDEKAFRNTCNLIDKIQFSRIHIFSYSDRPGTAACSFKGKIDPKTMAKRHEKLEQLRDRYMLKFHGSFRKRPVEVLVEQKDRKTGMYEGLTGNYIRVFFEGLPRPKRRGDEMGDESLGRLIPAKFKDFQGENVIARPVLV